MKIKVGYRTQKDIRIFLDDATIQQIYSIYLSLRQPNKYRYFYLLDHHQISQTTYKGVKFYSYKGHRFILGKRNMYKNIQLYDAAEHTLAFDVFVIFYDLYTERLHMQINKDYIRAVKTYISTLKKHRYIDGKARSLTAEEYERRISYILFQLQELAQYMMIWNDTKKSICKHIQKERILFYTSTLRKKKREVPSFRCHI